MNAVTDTRLILVDVDKLRRQNIKVRSVEFELLVKFLCA